MATRNKGEFDRNPALPGGLGASDQRAKEDLLAGIQARAAEEEVERQRQRLADVSVDGGGSVGASEDGRALRQPEEEGEARRARSTPESEGERRRMGRAEDSGERRRAGEPGEVDRRRLEGPLRNERDRLSRR